MADGSTRDVAIKLLKPDVRNRMLREKNIMIKCARDTDNHDRQLDGKPALGKDEKGGMQNTYEGQLLRIEEELDLTIEARNVELGKIYDKGKKDIDKKVKSMKLDSLVAPTSNAMVLEKAPGETIDSYLKRMDESLDEIMDIYNKRDENGMVVGTYASHKQFDDEIKKKYKNDPEKLYELKFKARPKHIMIQLGALLADLKKKKEYLMSFSQKWVNEGVFGEGFYHGDPHDGNIMIDDDGLTVIDFGNCTKLDEAQQLQVTKMVAAASVGETELFMEGFRALLRPEFVEPFDEKVADVKAAFDEIMKLGDLGSTGMRIAACLIKAQELGFEVPAAVQNFSQAQLRLSNTVDNFNAQIEKIQEKFDWISLSDTTLETAADYSDKRQWQYIKDRQAGDNNTVLIRDAALNDLVDVVESVDDYKFMISRYSNYFREHKIKKLETNARHIDAFIEAFKDAAKRLQDQPENYRKHTQAIGSWRRWIRTEMNNCKAALPYGLLDEVMFFLGHGNLEQAQIDIFVTRLTEAKQNIRLCSSKFNALAGRIKDVQKKHNKQFEPNEAEDAEITAMINDFRQIYQPYHQSLALYGGEQFFFTAFSKVESLMVLDRADIVHEMEQFLEGYPQFKQEFFDAYNAFINWDLQKKEIKDNDYEHGITLKKNLMSVYQRVMAYHFRTNYLMYEKAAEPGHVNFMHVTGRAINDNLGKSIKRLGMSGVSVSKKLNDRNKERRAIRAAVNEKQQAVPPQENQG
jgi:hypothetical protein